MNATIARPFRLGVLGGIGPEATGTFYLKLIAQLQNKGLIQRNEDFPQIIINSIPAPELIFDHIDEIDLLPYVQGIKELDAMKPDLIVMVCNTIHLFYDQLQKEIHTTILNLRKEVESQLQRRKVSAISIIGTPQTVGQGLYHFENIIYCNPTSTENTLLSDAIFKFNKGIDREKNKVLVENIVQACLAKGAQIVVLGCTELAVMLEGTPLPILDTVDILVAAVVRYYANRKQHNNLK